MEQLSLNLTCGDTLKSLKDRIEVELSAPIDLKITNNRSTMLSFKKNKQSLALRLHHMFLSAEQNIIRDLVEYIRTGRAILLDSFIKRNTVKIQRERKGQRKTRLNVFGKYFDLKKIYTEINQEYFAGLINCKITWGKKVRRRNYRSIIFGNYSAGERLIRIHPALDQEFIPAYFIEYIVYHEMLHAQVERTKRKVHTKEFKKREKNFKLYKEAVAWEKSNWGIFIRA